MYEKININDENVDKGECIDDCSEAVKLATNLEKCEDPYKCLIQPTEFLLGIGDLSGEVMRRCINSLGAGDFDTCFAACNFLQSLYTGYWNAKVLYKCFLMF